MTHPLHLALPLALALALSPLAGCKTDGETTPPDSSDTPDENDTPATEPADTGPVQEPDPPQLAEARTNYLLGNDKQVVDAMQPMLEDLKTRDQFRASGLSAAWLALALVRDVAENGKTPADYAISMADKTGDPEVTQAAKMALGAYQLGLMEFLSAATTLDEAISANPTGGDAALAMMLAGEATMNLAFGEGDKITNPEHLDTAAKHFEAAAALLTGAEPADKALLAKVTESQGAIARYKNDKKSACAKVDEAIKLYGEAGVAERTMEAAKQLRMAARCK